MKASGQKVHNIQLHLHKILSTAIYCDRKQIGHFLETEKEGLQ